MVKCLAFVSCKFESSLVHYLICYLCSGWPVEPVKAFVHIEPKAKFKLCVTHGHEYCLPIDFEHRLAAVNKICRSRLQ